MRASDISTQSVGDPLQRSSDLASDVAVKTGAADERDILGNSPAVRPSCEAQPQRPPLPPQPQHLTPPTGDGWELALAGSSGATYGEPYHVSGTAYRVGGLATLRPAPGAQVRVRIVTSTLPQQTIVEQSVAADREASC